MKASSQPFQAATQSTGAGQWSLHTQFQSVSIPIDHASLEGNVRRMLEFIGCSLELGKRGP